MNNEDRISNEQCTMNNVQWRKVKFGEVGYINPPNKDTIPNQFVYIDLECVLSGQLLFENQISKRNAPSRAQRIVNFNDVLYQTVRPYQQNNYIHKKQGNYVASTGYALIRCYEDFEPDFVYYLLHTHKFESVVLGLCTGTSYPAIAPNNLKRIEISIPSLPVQRRIAAILSSADKVIASTQKVIDKLKQIKQGMMDDLLKPKDGWRMVKLGELGTFKNGINKDKKQFGFGSLYVSISDAYYENIDFQLLNRLNATEKEIEEYSLLDNDIVFVRSSVKPSGVGYTTLFRHYDIEPVLFSGFMIRFRLNDKTHCCAEFFNYLFRNEEFRRQIINKSTVSANTNINQESLKELTCNVPDIVEQRKIARFLQGIDKKIETEINLLAKYKQIKKGLMEKLLNN